MASPLNIPLTTVSFFFIAVIGVSVVEADDCSALCGYTPPTTTEALNRSCSSPGDTISTPFDAVINWSDGTSSTYSADHVVLLAIGSCCFSKFQASYYGTGIITSGKFNGENLTIIYNDRSDNEEISAGDDRQTCKACQSSAGLSGLISDTLLSIGTKGMGNWIECTGTATTVFFPALTFTPQTIYTTFKQDLDQCSNCVESC